MADFTLEDVKELLGTQRIPGSPEELEVLTEWTQGVVMRKGTRYVRKNRKRIFRDWQFMRALGLSRV